MAILHKANQTAAVVAEEEFQNGTTTMFPKATLIPSDAINTNFDLKVDFTTWKHMLRRDVQ